uniref:Retrovirus-related Env polyprotein from transposon gypsy n=1 Tax=Ceratitis capitata TaxID=7213 RepID=W8BAW4_CERCA
MKSSYNLENQPETQILVNKIETLKNQLIPKIYRPKRSLNFLGSMLKFITGTPDHDDLVEIKTSLNKLIENNNKQRTINSQFERILETLDPKTITENIVISEVYNELQSITNTINFAKTNNFYSGTLNLKDVYDLISHEKLDLPIINILEYADIHICYLQEAIITIYKYPTLETKCSLFNVYPLAHKHGKINLDPKIAKCNKYQRISKCRNYMSNFICKSEPSDNCTMKILEGKSAQCETIHENNVPLRILETGYIFTDYQHIWNNIHISGPKLIHFNESSTIDNITYYNHQRQLREIMHNQHSEHLEVLRILSSNSIYKFSNIQKLSTFLIPIEENPVNFAFFIIMGFLTLVVITYGMVHLCRYYENRRMIHRQRQIDELYEIEMNRLQQQLVAAA